MTTSRTIQASVPFLFTLLASACASDPMPAIRQAYVAGDYVQARSALATLIEQDASNSHLWRAERSIVDLAMHEPKAAIEALRLARDRFDDLAGTDAVGWFGSVMLDDRQLAYQGYDYEKVLLRALLAIADLMAGGLDASAYALQVFETQQRIMQAFEDSGGAKPKLRYKLVAFGHYLRAIILENDPLNMDDARRNYARVLELEPGFPFGEGDLARAQHGVHSEKGNGVVHVLALVGRGPFRVETEEPVTQTSLAIAQWIWALSRDRAVIPNITAVPIPALAFHQDNPSEALVSVDGKPVAHTATVTDVQATAHSEFEAMKDSIIARAVLRRAFKIVVTEGTKELVNRDRRRQDGVRGDPLVDLGIGLAGILWTAFEAADLRCWSLLPASFQVLRLELPIGEHTITVQACQNGQPTGAPQEVQVLVRDGFNSYVVALLPTLAGGPPPMTSHPPQQFP